MSKMTAAAALAAQTPIGRAPSRALEACVALEHAQASVNAPVPPEIQAVLDADPAATTAAREALLAVIAGAEAPTVATATQPTGKPAVSEIQTPPAGSAEPKE